MKEYSRRELVEKGLGSVLGLFSSRFKSLLPPTPEEAPTTDFLSVAKDAARWIAESGFQSEYGYGWPIKPGRSSEVAGDLYSGSAGVALYFTELATSTGETHYYELAERCLPLLRAHLGRSPGLYAGDAGIGWVAAYLHSVSGSAIAGKLASDVRDRAYNARSDSQCLDSFDVISGLAGLGFYWLDAHGGNDPEVAKHLGQQLIAGAVETDHGLKWTLNRSSERTMPNFSHGNAGIVAFLSKLGKATSTDVYVDAAIRGAHYMIELADRTDDGCRLYHDSAGGRELFYVGWCHGPVGLAQTFWSLHNVTGEPEWLEWLRRCVRSVDASGAPTRPSEGYWNNFGLCCGAAGLGEFYLGLFRATHEAPSFEKARNIAHYLIRESSPVGGRSWIHAENRTQPNEVAAQTGWMQGAAGIGAFFLHLHLKQQGKNPPILTPDRFF